MPSALRKCTECGTDIPEGSRASTCSNRCRSRKSRRVAKAKSRAGSTPWGGDRPENEVYEPEQHEIARKVVAAELQPYIREQISEDVVKAIGGMLALTPRVVAVLEQDLLHNDPQIRMKAAALIAKYSMPEKFMPGDVGGDNKVEVVIGVPTPTNYGATESDTPSTAEELRECQRCGKELPESAFDAGAPRCDTCQEVVRSIMAP